MKSELHCHSTCSDGSLAPAEVAARAGRYGVELFCLTDHDSVNGYAATRALLPSSVRVLKGLELSTVEHGKTVHLLCYGLDDGEGCTALEAKLAELRAQRGDRLRQIVDRLRTMGVILDADLILEARHGETPGRPHVAQALVEAGAVRTFQEAFERYLGDDKPAYVPTQSLSVGDGLAWARAAGAKVSLAHPHTLNNFGRVKALFRQHRDAGLEGIEGWYGKYGPAQREPWLRLAKDLDLVVTGGSDFHGAPVPTVVRPGIDLPDAVAQSVLQWLA
ncbi:MAG: PHP domain-containing protein [Nannocystaceae bacterium]